MRELFLCARAGVMSTFSPLCGEKSPERSEGDEGWLKASEMPIRIRRPQVLARLKADPLRCAPLRPAAARTRLRRDVNRWLASFARCATGNGRSPYGRKATCAADAYHS